MMVRFFMDSISRLWPAQLAGLRTYIGGRGSHPSLALRI